jgi:anthranilate phosphoribosyltransferase
MLQDLTDTLTRGESLTRAQMNGAIDQMMRGEVAAEEIGAFLLASRAKGETVEELVGAATAMREHMTAIRTQRTGLVDTCGTGGVGSKLFNVSTTAAIVTAACGVPVAKHGNRSVTSKSGSADVLAALGVNIQAPVEIVEQCLDELGICFCFAQSMHPAMKHVAPVRKQLGVPTIFNLLGPLCNPASAPFQVMGVGRQDLRPMMAEVLLQLGTEHAVVVSGDDGLGEITLATTTQVTEVRAGALHDFVWSPEHFGLAPASLDNLTVAGPGESAALIRNILAGESGPPRDIVILNAAAALWTAGVNPSPVTCAQRAAAALDTGAAGALLHRLAALSHC